MNIQEKRDLELKEGYYRAALKHYRDIVDKYTKKLSEVQDKLKRSYDTTMSYGQKIKIGRSEYMLAAIMVDGRRYAVLINTQDGNRWSDPIEVSNFDHDVDIARFRGLGEKSNTKFKILNK